MLILDRFIKTRNFLIDQMCALPKSKAGDVWINDDLRVFRSFKDKYYLLSKDGSIKGSKEELVEKGRVFGSRRPQEITLLIHGLGRNGRSFDQMFDILNKSNIPAIRFCYPSYNPILETSSQIFEFCESLIKEGVKTINIVGHSMGGIIGRILMNNLGIHAGKFITLGSPHQGSKMAWYVRRKDLYPDFVKKLPDFKTHSIIGTSLFGKSDGIVSCDEAIPNFGSTYYIKGFHSLLPQNLEAINLVIKIITEE